MAVTSELADAPTPRYCLQLLVSCIDPVVLAGPYPPGSPESRKEKAIKEAHNYAPLALRTAPYGVAQRDHPCSGCTGENKTCFMTSRLYSRESGRCLGCLRARRTCKITVGDKTIKMGREGSVKKELERQSVVKNGQAISTLQELDQHCRQLDLQVDMTAKEIRDLIDEVFKVCSVKTDRSEDTGQTRYYFPFKEKGAMFPDALPGNQGEVALPFPPWAPADVPNDEMTGDETAVDDLLGNELLGNDSPGNGMPADNMDVDDQNGGKDDGKDDGKDVGKDDDINKTDDDETDADEPNDDTNKSTTTTDGSRTSDTDSDEELDAPTFRDGSYVSESEDEEEQQFVIDDNLNAPRTNEDPLYDWDQAVLEYTDAGLKLVKILPFHLRDQIKVKDFCERLLAAPQPFGRDATSIQEMMYATSFFRAIHLDIQSSSIDWRIPGSVQSSHILLPVQVIWELRRAFFFHRCRNLAVQQRATFETVIDGWRSTYPSSLPPDSFRIKLWQHVHPSNGLPRDVHYWTIHRLKTLTHTLQRETETFQEKMAEQVGFYKAVSEAFGVEL